MNAIAASELFVYSITATAVLTDLTVQLRFSREIPMQTISGRALTSVAWCQLNWIGLGLCFDLMQDSPLSFSLFVLNWFYGYTSRQPWRTTKTITLLTRFFKSIFKKNKLKTVVAQNSQIHTLKKFTSLKNDTLKPYKTPQNVPFNFRTLRHILMGVPPPGVPTLATFSDSVICCKNHELYLFFSPTFIWDFL